MIVVNYDKGFAEMLQHPAFRNRRTHRHPVDVDPSPSGTTKIARRSTARGRDGGVRGAVAVAVGPGGGWRGGWGRASRLRGDEWQDPKSDTALWTGSAKIQVQSRKCLNRHCYGAR